MNNTNELKINKFCDDSFVNNIIKDNSIILINTNFLDDSSKQIFNISDTPINYGLISTVENSADEEHAKFFLNTIDKIKINTISEDINKPSADNKIKDATVATESLNYIKNHIIQNSKDGLSVIANQSPAIVLNLV